MSLFYKINARELNIGNEAKHSPDDPLMGGWDTARALMHTITSLYPAVQLASPTQLLKLRFVLLSELLYCETHRKPSCPQQAPHGEALHY